MSFFLTSKNTNDDVELVLSQLRPYLTDDEIAYARSLDSYSDVEEFLTECLNKRMAESPKQPEVCNAKTYEH